MAGLTLAHGACVGYRCLVSGACHRSLPRGWVNFSGWGACRLRVPRCVVSGACHRSLPRGRRLGKLELVCMGKTRVDCTGYR